MKWNWFLTLCRREVVHLLELPEDLQELPLAAAPPDVRVQQDAAVPVSALPEALQAAEQPAETCCQHASGRGAPLQRGHAVMTEH